MASHNELGKWGEQKAEEYLIAKGYRIVECNWRYGRRDIDIIAAIGTTLVFVEVKTRSRNLFTEPVDAIDKQKILSLSLAANAFIKRYRVNADIRFDVISIVGTNNDNCIINHIEDAFLPIYI